MIEVTMNGPSREIPKIYVVGIGGAGNNAVERMIEAGNENVDYLCINTELQILNKCKCEKTLQIGAKLTGGYGAGADPSIGEAAAEESKDTIKDNLSDARMVILTCGLGGGTGTGAVPVIAKTMKELGILTVAVVTLPFSFEGPARTLAATNGLENLKSCVDTLIVVPNEKLLDISDKDLELEDAFLLADAVLKNLIEGIIDIIFYTGTVNIDLNDIRTTLKDKGLGHLGKSVATESKPLIEAVKEAIASPLLTTNIKGATNILLNTSGKVKMKDVNEAISYVRDIACENAQIIWGTVTNSSRYKEGESEVTLIATGLKDQQVIPSKKNPSGNKNVSPRSTISYMSKSVVEFMEEMKKTQAATITPKNIVVPSFLKNIDKKGTSGPSVIPSVKK
ncbi:MAG: cell division protein FtsZ [Lachnospiraceae bacterium]|nr:cell division protein FtsZ [Lachnospiraceae bacterium]